MSGNTGARRILIVEDDCSTRETIFKFLQTSGYNCYSAGSAEEALEFLYGSEVDLVITDVMMPGRTGLELTEWITRETGSDVIIMTGYLPNCSYELAMELGASGFFYKPIKLAHMLGRVKSILKNRECGALPNY
jgi:DNA-binding response OmpR family regulator